MLKKLILVLALSLACVAQTTHKAGMLDLSQTWTGVNNFKNLSTIRFADQFSTLAAAASDCGGTSCVVVIPSGTYAGQCPPLVSKVVYWDFRGDGSISCTQNVFAYNHNDGNVNAMVLEQQQVQGYASSGSALTHWFQTFCNNCDVSATPGGGLDGVSTEVVFTGTLTGTVQAATGNESPVFVQSTGGTITAANGIQGYITDIAGRTTAITTGIGVDGLGCYSMTGTPKPVNCYGLYGHDQNISGGQASSRNYSIGLEGRGLLRYSGNSGSAGFDVEDHLGAVHDFIYTDSSDNAYLKAMPSATLNLIGAGGTNAMSIDTGNVVRATAGIQPSNGVAPTCDASHRGIFWYVPGSAGVKDVVEVCVKSSGDVYSWASIY